MIVLCVILLRRLLCKHTLSLSINPWKAQPNLSISTFIDHFVSCSPIYLANQSNLEKILNANLQIACSAFWVWRQVPSSKHILICIHTAYQIILSKLHQTCRIHQNYRDWRGQTEKERGNQSNGHSQSQRKRHQLAYQTHTTDTRLPCKRYLRSTGHSSPA